MNSRRRIRHASEEPLHPAAYRGGGCKGTMVHAAARARCTALVRKWPISEMTVPGRGGRFRGSTRRQCDAADRRRLRQPDAGQALATLVSGIEASSSMPATKLGGGN
jgi:hypothetical protein